MYIFIFHSVSLSCLLFFHDLSRYCLSGCMVDQESFNNRSLLTHPCPIPPIYLSRISPSGLNRGDRTVCFPYQNYTILLPFFYNINSSFVHIYIHQEHACTRAYIYIYTYNVHMHMHTRLHHSAYFLIIM